MIGIVLWIKRIVDRVLYVFPWLKPKKSNLTNKNIIHKTIKKDNKEYRCKVCASLYIDDNGSISKVNEKKMLSNKLFSCPEEEAIKLAYEEMDNYYKSIQKKTELNDDELVVYFEDGVTYRFTEAEVILYTDNDFKKKMRELNDVLRDKMMKQLNN